MEGAGSRSSGCPVTGVVVSGRKLINVLSRHAEQRTEDGDLWAEVSTPAQKKKFLNEKIF